MKKNFLLTPGPVGVSPEVLLEMAHPLIHHRTPQFIEIFKQVQDGLKYLHQTTRDVFVMTASANHSWGDYHWARTANPFTLQIGDNVSLQWDASLGTTSGDWSQSSVLDTKIVAGGTATDVRKCRATSGRVEVCNAKYGNNGWLGVASIWVNVNHITKGTVKVTTLISIRHHTIRPRGAIL